MKVKVLQSANTLVALFLYLSCLFEIMQIKESIKKLEGQ